MYVGPRLRRTLSRLDSASSAEELRDGLADAAIDLGFPFVALVQHGGLPRLIEGTMAITNYPSDFVQFYITNHCQVYDPIYDVSQRLDRPFDWEEISSLIDLTELQLALFEKARRYGIAHGVTVPLSIPSEAHASCTFATPEPISMTASRMATLQIVAAFGFKAALRLHHLSRGTNTPRLTRREAECTALVALGKSDWEIGKILGLGPATVKYFVSAAKQRYGVHKRSELVARALMDAQLLGDTNKGKNPSR